MKELQAILQQLNAPNARPAVLATLVTVEGSSYRRPGARLILTADGGRDGSISGGCLEEDVLLRAREVAATGRPDLALYDTTEENDLVWGTGLGCHGVVRVFLEPVPARPAWARRLAENLAAHRPTDLAVVWHAGAGVPAGTRLAADLASLPPDARVFRQTVKPAVPLVIFGAGDDARPLARLAREIGWQVTVADPRPAFPTAERFPEATRRICAPAEELVQQAAPPPDAAVVVMTHHYVHDRPLPGALLARPLAYLGLLGPRQRAEKILRDLAADGVAVTPEMRRRLRAPVGLDLGAEVPEEVALAILAEIQATLARRDGRPLRERTGPIHG